MVVPPEGGRCDCPTCGASCPGQFKGCGLVVRVGGYVPVAAPDWAKPHGARRAERDTPALALRTGRPQPQSHDSPLPAVVDDAQVALEVTEVRSLVLELLDRPDRAVAAIELVRNEMAQRDDELAKTFERLAVAYTKLLEEVAADRTAREELATAVTRLEQRLDVARPLFGFRKLS